MKNYVILIIFVLVFFETFSQPQKSLVEYKGGQISINYFKSKDNEKVYKQSNDDVHIKLKIVDKRLNDLTLEEINAGIQIDFIDSLGKKVQPANLAFIHYSKERDVKSTGDGKPRIIRKNLSVIDITIPIRTRIKRARSEGIAGYNFHPGQYELRIAILAGDEKQELRIPVHIR